MQIQYYSTVQTEIGFPCTQIAYFSNIHLYGGTWGMCGNSNTDPTITGCHFLEASNNISLLTFS